jgi:hypothetical protein
MEPDRVAFQGFKQILRVLKRVIKSEHPQAKIKN